MCDYSIRHVASRPAKVRDKLVTTVFGARTNRGFAGVEDHNVAVCLRPGTELVFEKVPEYDHFLGRFFSALRSRKTGGHKVARFRQVNVNEVGVHHDALEFPNGQTVMVADLIEGQRASVLQLPATADREEHRHGRRVVDPAEAPEVADRAGTPEIT